MFNRYLLAFCMIFALISCENIHYEGEPQFILYIQDAPAEDFVAFDTAIDKVEIFNGNSWISLQCATNTFDLLSYNGIKMFKLCEQNLPLGTYEQLKITFSTTRNSLQIGQEKHSVLTTVQDAELTFNYNFDAVQNSQTIVVCDIDVAKSIRYLDDQYHFNPHATIVDLSQWGAINGMLVSSISNTAINSRFLVTAVREDGYTMNNYTYDGELFIRLPQGVYNITITPPTESKYLIKVISQVVVGSYKPTVLGVITIQEQQ